MRKILLAVLAVVLAGLPAWAEDVDTVESTVGGTIPALCQILIAGNLTGLLTLAQDGSGESAYDDGYIESAADATVLTLDANKNWKLSVKYNGDGWSCPGAYDKDESDLLIQITNVPTGTIQNSFDGYVSPTVANVEMLLHASGVSNNEVEIQTKVLLDWTADIPGAYAITLTYTMETYTP